MMNDLSKPIKEKEQARFDKLCVNIVLLVGPVSFLDACGPKVNAIPAFMFPGLAVML